MFLETADNERVHAQKFFSFLESGDAVEIVAAYPAGRVGTTYENLIHAAEGENEEHTILYPEFARVAKEEGFAQVAAAFTLIAKKIEVEHELRYRKLAENVKTEHVFKKKMVVQDGSAVSAVMFTKDLKPLTRVLPVNILKHILS